jgi:transcriptional regulator with XRE-family HTH domain
MSTESTDETHALDVRLRDRMQDLEISSFRQLAKRCGVSRYSIEKLRKGEIGTLSVTIADRIAAGLHLSLMDLLTWARGIEFQHTSQAIDRLSAAYPVSPQPDYQQEYEHLQVQFLAQRDILQTEFQQEAIDRLESWLRNWPKVVYAVTHDKPDLLASKILPLLRPLESLLQAWGLETIGSLGDRVPYNPHHHQLITNLDPLLPGAIVEIQRPGYLHQGKLIFRAEVSLLPEA